MEANKKFGRKSLLLVVTILSVTAISLRTPIKEDFFEMSKQLEILNSAFRELNIFYVDDLSPGDLMETGIDAMLESLDPYTKYYPETRIEEARFMSTGEYGGLGLSLRINWDGRFLISSLIPNSPAENEGLLLGDEIIAIDGMDIKGLEIEQIGDKIKGASGTEVVLEIIHHNSIESSNLEIIREKIKKDDVPYFGMLDDETGYLTLSKFTKTSSSEVRKSLIHLTDSMGATRIVFDLRGNGGGLLREAVNIVNLFVHKGTEVVVMKGKTPDWNKNYSTLRRALLPEIPLIILIDDKSASASEIVAGALQELDRAVIIGMESFGKGLVQQTKNLEYGARIKITVAKYYTPSGRCVQRLHYGDRDESGNAKTAADSTLKVFYTSNGRPVVEGRGVFPDIVVEPVYSNYVVGGLYESGVIFDYALSESTTTINEAKGFNLTDEKWEEFVDYVRLAFENDLRPFPYEASTKRAIDYLEEAMERDGISDGNDSIIDAFKVLSEPQLVRDIENNKELLRITVEEELIFHRMNKTGVYEYSLPSDPNIITALSVFDGSRYLEILSGPEK
jgi:carboxyl-terminal processing protease